MEFNQFHPTCLYHPHAKSFLITEAVRGEGGVLKLPNGERFMQRFDPRAELAPRDIVARAIDHEMKRLGIDCVHLDISHKRRSVHARALPDHLRALPRIRHRYHARTDPGGSGRALHLRRRHDRSRRAAPMFRVSTPIGETAFTGLHGANRMASNSLLECLVFARAAAAEHSERIRTAIAEPSPTPDWDASAGHRFR